MSAGIGAELAGIDPGHVRLNRRSVKVLETLAAAGDRIGAQASINPACQGWSETLAEPGGYNNRPREPPPGPQVICTGLRRMLDFAIARQA